MGKNRQQSGLVNVISYDVNNNVSLTSSPSSSIQTSGSVVATSITGSFTGSVFGIGNTATFSSSVNNRVSSIETITASNISRLTSLEGFSSSVYTTNTFTTSANTRLTELENKTGSLASTGSNTFYGTQIISGTTWIAGDFIVQGSSSIQYISASSVSIGTNVVNLNTANPAVRYGGISVQDSGSANGVTGSMLWDSTCNRWIYSNPSGVGYSGGILMSGPRAASLGTETTLTCNYVAKSGGGDHLYDSCIIDDGTTICIKGNTITNNIIINNNQNAATQITVCNTTCNTAAAAELLLNSDVCSGFASIGKYSTGTTTYKTVASKDMYIYNQTGGDITILNNMTTGNIKLTAGGGSSPHLYINCNGNIGIGTISPTNLIHASSSLPRIIADTTSRYAVFNMYVNGSEKGAVYWDNTDNLLRVQSNQSVALAYGGSSTSYGLYLNTSGNIGIKHSSPVETLDIMGSLRIRCNTPNFTAECNSLVIDYVNTSIFGSSPTSRYYSIGCTGVSAGHTFVIGAPASPVNAFVINGNGMVGINTDNFGTGTTGTALILRPSSSNTGQTAIVLQDYRKCSRWAVNGQNGANDATLTFYSTPSNTNDYTPVFTITQAGQIQRPCSAAFQATINTGTNIGTAGGHIQFNCVLYNAGGGYNGTNSTFTAPVSGLYQFNFVFLNQNTQNTTGGHSFLSTNYGVGTYYFTRYGCNSGTDRTGYGGYVPMFGSFAVYLPAGYKACVGAFWDADGAFSHNSTAWGNFSGYLVG